jgi:hypothetical protein
MVMVVVAGELTAPDVDWGGAICRRKDVFCEQMVDRKHGPAPVPQREGGRRLMTAVFRGHFALEFGASPLFQQTASSRLVGRSKNAILRRRLAIDAAVAVPQDKRIC